MVSVILLAIVQLLADELFSFAILCFTAKAMMPLLFPDASLTSSYSSTEEFRKECFLFNNTFSTITAMLMLFAAIFFLSFAYRLFTSSGFDVDLDLTPKSLVILVVKSTVSYLLTVVLAADALLGLTLRQEVQERKSEEVKAAHARSFEAVASIGIAKRSKARGSSPGATGDTQKVVPVDAAKQCVPADGDTGSSSGSDVNSAASAPAPAARAPAAAHIAGSSTASAANDMLMNASGEEDTDMLGLGEARCAAERPARRRRRHAANVKERTEGAEGAEGAEPDADPVPSSTT
jgi:hypothetical protein